jgi:hypothetical protein
MVPGIILAAPAAPAALGAVLEPADGVGLTWPGALPVAEAPRDIAAPGDIEAPALLLGTDAVELAASLQPADPAQVSRRNPKATRPLPEGC